MSGNSGHLGSIYHIRVLVHEILKFIADGKKINKIIFEPKKTIHSNNKKNLDLLITSNNESFYYEIKNIKDLSYKEASLYPLLKDLYNVFSIFKDTNNKSFILFISGLPGTASIKLSNEVQLILNVKDNSTLNEQSKKVRELKKKVFSSSMIAEINNFSNFLEKFDLKQSLQMQQGKIENLSSGLETDQLFQIDEQIKLKLTKIAEKLEILEKFTSETYISIANRIQWILEQNIMNNGCLDVEIHIKPIILELAKSFSRIELTSDLNKSKFSKRRTEIAQKLGSDIGILVNMNSNSITETSDDV